MKATMSTLLNDLLDSIRKERQLITALNHEELMSLLPRKLALLEQIEKLCSKTDDIRPLAEDEEVKQTLKLVKEENELNRIFLEEMSEAYNDLWSLLMPTVYNSKGKQEHISETTKGTNFSAEA